MISSSAPKQIQLWAHDQSIIHHPVFDCNRRLSPELDFGQLLMDYFVKSSKREGTSAVDRALAIPRYDVFCHMNHTHKRIWPPPPPNENIHSVI